MLLFSVLWSAITAANITVKLNPSQELSITGTQTSMMFGFNPTTMPTFAILIMPSGRETTAPTVVASGFCVSANAYTPCQVKSGSKSITMVSGASATATTNSVTMMTSAVTANGLSMINNRVYPFCYVRQGMIGTSDYTSLQNSCGAYHTMTSSITGQSVDRNLGNMQASSTYNSSTTNNIYNISIYGSIWGDENSGGMANAAFVAYVSNSTSSLTTFKMWGGVGVGQLRMVNQDMATSHVETTVGDCYSTQRAANSVKFDNDTSFSTMSGCVNNVAIFSGGLDTSSISDAYYYTHYSRPTKTTDTNCDDDITLGTKLCYVWQDGDSTLQNFAAQHDGSSCFTLVHGQWLAMGLMMLLTTLL